MFLVGVSKERWPLSPLGTRVIWSGAGIAFFPQQVEPGVPNFEQNGTRFQTSFTCSFSPSLSLSLSYFTFLSSVHCILTSPGSQGEGDCHPSTQIPHRHCQVAEGVWCGFRYYSPHRHNHCVAPGKDLEPLYCTHSEPVMVSVSVGSLG